MIKRYDYLTFILDIDEAKTQTEIQIDKIDKIQVVIEMMHTQTIMRILVSFFLVTFHSGHLKIIELIISVSLNIYICVCVCVCAYVNLEKKQIYIPSHLGYIKTGLHAVCLEYNNVQYYLN
jgi:hypothetical protein